MVVGTSANAQVVFDNDSGDGTWETATNWSGDALPGAGDNVQIHSGFTTSLTSDQTVADFTVASDGAGGSAGVVNHSAGTISGAGTSWAKIGTDGAGNNGDYNMSGSAALANFDVLALGINGGVGVLNMQDNASISTNSGFASGGTTTINQSSGSVASGNWLALGNFDGGVVNYNLSGGSVSNGGDVFTVGEGGIGNLLVSGNAVVDSNGDSMILGRNDNSTGLVDITGSSADFSVNSLIVDNAAGSTGTLSWTADGGGITEIVAAGDTTFGDNANLLVDLSADADFGLWGATGTLQEITLINNTGANAISGTFVGLAEGASVDIGGKTALISYVGGDGNDVVLQVFAVPEPSSLVILGIAGIGLVSRRRR